MTELRASVTEHQTRQCADITALTERLAALETRANRSGTTPEMTTDAIRSPV